MGFISHHIMPLVINNLWDGDTHIHTYAYTNIANKSNYKKHLNSQVTVKSLER